MQTDAVAPVPRGGAKKPPPPPPPLRPAVDPLGLVGSRVEVLWPRYKGYFVGDVTAYDVTARGKLIHNVVYDNPGKV